MDIKTLCLGVLSLGDASGYEIKKIFEESFSHFYVAGYGSIYPALAELSREGYITGSEFEQEKRPAKKVYHLTEAGLEAFRLALADTYPSHRVRSDFLAILFFSHLLSSAQLTDVLAKRMTDIDATLAHIESYHARCDVKCPPGTVFAAGFARAVLEAGKEYIEQHQESLLRNHLKEEGSA